MRKRYYILANFYVIVLAGLIIASPQSKEKKTSYEKLYSKLLSLGKADALGTASVENLELKRDAAIFSFETGQFILLPEINNRPAALLFMGNGTFRFTPPTEIESEQLARFYKKDALNEEFETLFLLFNDSTYHELSKKVTFDSTRSHIPRKVKTKIKDCLDYLHDDKNNYFDTNIMKSFLDGQRDGLFYAQMSKGRATKPLFFKIDPYEVEEVRLMRRADLGHLHDVAEVVSQFHLEKDYVGSKIPSGELKSLIKIHHSEIEASVKNNLGLDFSARATIEFSLRQKDQAWVYFKLFWDLKVDSLFWENGSNATFFQGKENSRVWVELDSSLAANEKMKLVFHYHGDLLKRGGDGRIAIRSSANWYPTHGSREPATFDLIFHSPAKFEVFSVGKKISEEKEKKVLTSRWEVHTPINFASFNLGDYKKHSFDDDGTPPITVMASSQSRKIKDVAGDVMNSMALFNEIFGPYPVESLFVTETPYRHGLAFRGLIHLSASTLKSTGSEGYDEVFRGHEVAHQWWGIEVDYQTYHDKWLSEGLCDFAGLRYMQTVLQKKNGTKKYFNILDDWRKEILENRKYIFGKGQEAGPIWLGYRTSSTETEGDYGLIIYKKGAWVFHMLRMMFLDLKNMSNEDTFNKMMRDYYSRFRGKKASTSDFQKVVEEHIGMDMDWFFRQWVFETGIPKYTFAYKTEQTPAGKFLIKAKVRQTNVSEAFKMPIIFNIDFGKQGSYTTRKFVTGAESEIELLLSPIKPKKVVFNYLKSALCEQKTKKWK